MKHFNPRLYLAQEDSVAHILRDLGVDVLVHWHTLRVFPVLLRTEQDPSEHIRRRLEMRQRRRRSTVSLFPSAPVAAPAHAPAAAAAVRCRHPFTQDGHEHGGGGGR